MRGLSLPAVHGRQRSLPCSEARLQVSIHHASGECDQEAKDAHYVEDDFTLSDVRELAADHASEDAAKANKCPGVCLKLLTSILRVETRLAYHKAIDNYIHKSTRERNKRA